MPLFQNGNRRIARLVIYELGAGVGIMVCSQVMGSLPAQDWMSQEHMKKVCFALGVVVTLLKGMELFFSKTITMFKSHELDGLSDLTSALNENSAKLKDNTEAGKTSSISVDHSEVNIQTKEKV